jgi:hypothetical protein
VALVCPHGCSLFSHHLAQRRFAWHFRGTFRGVELQRHGGQSIVPRLQIPLHHSQVRVTDEVHGKFGIARVSEDLACDHPPEPVRRAQRQVRDTGRALRLLQCGPERLDPVDAYGANSPKSMLLSDRIRSDERAA